MQKNITLFQRNYESDRLVRNEVVTGAEWVLVGEGTPTRKWNGTACLVKDGRLFKRYEIKRGRQTPEGFVAAQEPDPVTGEQPGWVPVGDGPEDKWHREAWIPETTDGTYELCGPKIQGNAEGRHNHVLLRHGSEVLEDGPRDFDGLREYLISSDIEGIVWHHPDGRMVKLKKRDFVRGSRR